MNQDHVDSMAVLTEATFGNAVRRIRYEPFGQEASSTGSVASKQSFGSHYRDDESGLLFMGGRYYDAALSRFTQPDSIVPEPDDPQSWNRYSYTRNNPVNRVDPTGHADISTAGDVADAFDKKAGQATDILGDWVENSGGNVVVATATKTAIDLGKGLVDTLRLGQGAGEGGIGGFSRTTRCEPLAWLKP